MDVVGLVSVLPAMFAKGIVVAKDGFGATAITGEVEGVVASGDANRSTSRGVEVLCPFGEAGRFADKMDCRMAY